jgi:hypothetical protein
MPTIAPMRLDPWEFWADIEFTLRDMT